MKTQVDEFEVNKLVNRRLGQVVPVRLDPDTRTQLLAERAKLIAQHERLTSKAKTQEN